MSAASASALMMHRIIPMTHRISSPNLAGTLASRSFTTKAKLSPRHIGRLVPRTFLYSTKSVDSSTGVNSTIAAPETIGHSPVEIYERRLRRSNPVNLSRPNNELVSVATTNGNPGTQPTIYVDQF